VAAEPPGTHAGRKALDPPVRDRKFDDAEHLRGARREADLPGSASPLPAKLGVVPRGSSAGGRPGPAAAAGETAVEQALTP
jgi:hypothetical protein